MATGAGIEELKFALAERVLAADETVAVAQTNFG